MERVSLSNERLKALENYLQDNSVLYGIARCYDMAELLRLRTIKSYHLCPSPNGDHPLGLINRVDA